MGGGTIFNLDNSGSIRSKNFYITPEGNASFRGNISAGSGDIGGWIINPTSLSKGGIVLNSATPEISYNAGTYSNFVIGTGLIQDLASSTTIKNTTYNGDGGTFWAGERDINNNLQNYIRFDNYTGYTRAVFYQDGISGYKDEIIWVIKKTNSNSAALRVDQGGVLINTVGTSNGGYALRAYGDAYFEGDVTANASDSRLKTNIKNIDSPLEKISKINGVYFNWNELAKDIMHKDVTTREVGFIAQEMQKIMPEIVKPTAVKVDTKTDEKYLTIQYEKIVPLLVECIKELKSEIEELKRNK
jgi:hypothetical protein